MCKFDVKVYELSQHTIQGMLIPEKFTDLTTEQGDRVVKWVKEGNQRDRDRRREAHFLPVRDIPSRWLECGCGANTGTKWMKFCDLHLRTKAPQPRQLQSAYHALKWDIDVGNLILE